MDSISMIAVGVPLGSMPKKTVRETNLEVHGPVGNCHEHEKHMRPRRALFIQDSFVHSSQGQPHVQFYKFGNR